MTPSLSRVIIPSPTLFLPSDRAVRPPIYSAYKALIAAEFSGAKIRVVSDPPDFVLGETNKTVAYLAKFPMGKVPAFESADGKNLFESNAIAFYLANEQLRGISVEDQVSSRSS